MNNNYEEKRQARINRYKELAEKNQIISNQLSNKAHAMAETIPFGQPIIVGHHSEKKDRVYMAKIEQTFKKSMEINKKAEYYTQKAEVAINNSSISSDNPKGIELLKEKLNNLQNLQEIMKAANKIVRNKKISKQEKIQEIIKLGLTEESAKEALTPNFCGEIGFPSYQLQNNNAKINSVKKRIIELEKRAEEKTTEEVINNIKIIDNVEENRLQIFLDDIPTLEIRQKLKRNGFKWSRFNRCWQRYRNTCIKKRIKEFLSTQGA